MNVIFASYGNDSVALIQLAYMRGLKDVIVAYSDTGWASASWETRVNNAEAWVKGLGFGCIRLKSEGMADLCRRKKAWPRGGGGRFQFCTKELKEIPAMIWLDEVDPEKDAVCMIGIRREESMNRRTFPEWIEESERHGGRSLSAPLVRYTEKDRNELLEKTPFEPLPWRSKECWPCVNARKGELRLLDEPTVNKILRLEDELGVNSKGNPRVMFSPKRHNGATGIRDVVQDARLHMDDLFNAGCDGGWCGS